MQNEPWVRHEPASVSCALSSYRGSRAHRARPAGTSLSILIKNFLNSIARWRACNERITCPVVLTGLVVGQCLPRHCHVDFLRFLRTIDREVHNRLQA